MTDLDGNEYVDVTMAYGPLILGHSHPGGTFVVKNGQVQEGATPGRPIRAPIG